MLDNSKLYRLPWTKHQNPNGWIEVTTYCQLACPGCYRGLDQKTPPRIHNKVSDLKKQIDWQIKNRAIQVLSIAGGEPLIYPELNEIVSYSHKKGLNVRILTNGVALTKKRLTELRDKGANEIVIHISEYQNRPSSKLGKNTFEERENYCQMFREVKGIELDFIMTVNQKNYKGLHKIIKFYKKNSDIISHTFFTLFRDIFFENPEYESKKSYVGLEKLAKQITKSYRIEPCGYLGKTLNPNGISWLFYGAIFHGQEIIGYVDNQLLEKLHKLYYKEGKYVFPVAENRINILKTVTLLTNHSARNIILNYLKRIIRKPKNLFEPLRCQIIDLINTPTLTPKGWDLCNGCPDAILYKNKLVPSCLLERIKLGENITL